LRTEGSMELSGVLPLPAECIDPLAPNDGAPQDDNCVGMVQGNGVGASRTSRSSTEFLAVVTSKPSSYARRTAEGGCPHMGYPLFHPSIHPDGVIPGIRLQHFITAVAPSPDLSRRCCGAGTTLESCRPPEAIRPESRWGRKHVYPLLGGRRRSSRSA